MEWAHWLIVLLLAVVNFPFVWLMERHVRKPTSKHVYDLSPTPEQTRREISNALVTTPVHALLLLGFIWLGLLQPAADSVAYVLLTFVVTFLWTEVWHYASHVAMHTRPLLFIHREHHESKITAPWTSVSFSFLEKLIFSLGILGFMAALSHLMPVSVVGIGLYYLLYFFTNTLGHANLEIRQPGYYQTLMGKVFNTPTFHAMHHARYIKNYGLMTPCLDRLFGTAWEDFEAVQTRAAQDQPLQRLGERIKRV